MRFEMFQIDQEQKQAESWDRENSEPILARQDSEESKNGIVRLPSMYDDDSSPSEEIKFGNFGDDFSEEKSQQIQTTKHQQQQQQQPILSQPKSSILEFCSVLTENFLFQIDLKERTFIKV